MEYERKDWKRSDGRYRNHGKESMEKEKPLSAYHPAEYENTKEKRSAEMMRMESSYGGIALGANRQKEISMVVHEKRRSAGCGLRKDHQEIEGRHTAAISELRGDFRTNSHSRQESAFIYKEEQETTPLRMMERIQEMMDENVQQSGRNVLPFMRRREDEKERKEIQQQLRSSLEKGDTIGYQLWNRKQESFFQEQSEKQEMYRKFYRELEFSKEKAKKLMHKDVTVPAGEFKIPEEKTEEIPPQDQENPPEEKNYKKS